MAPVNKPDIGSTNAVTINVNAEIDAPDPFNANAAFSGKIITAPKISKNPAIEAAGTYLPNRGNQPENNKSAISNIINIPETTGSGALAVAEIILSTGAPPSKLVPISAKACVPVRIFRFTGFGLMPVN